MVINKAKGGLFGVMDKSMMESGAKEKNMEVECGKHQKHQNSPISDNGSMANLTALEFILMKLEIDTKVSLKMV